MKKFLIFIIFIPLVSISQNESPVNEDRSNIVINFSSSALNSNTNIINGRSLSIGYIIFNNLYIGFDITGNEGLNAVGRYYFPNSNLYWTSKYRGSIENGKTYKNGIGYEHFLFSKSFLSIFSEALYYNYRREDIKENYHLDLGVWLSEFGSSNTNSITTTTEYINENFSGFKIILGLQFHF
tara:strand:+ start:14665 stop:15210 length:546 start_codon:yes stop_codon:yes gene_type:complete